MANDGALKLTGKKGAAYQPSSCSYTPSAPINPLSYGKGGGRANAQGGSVPSVEANGSVVGALSAMPGTLRIGEDKNVSTPVSG